MKIRFYLALAAAALVMTNCSKEEEPVQEKQQSKGFTATIEGASRSAVTDAGVFSWTAGDKISVWNGSSFDTYANLDSDVNTFNPEGSANIANAKDYAIYPASVEHNFEDGYLLVNLPTSYAYGSTNAPMLATIEEGSNSLAFRHLGGLMRFVVKNVPVGASSFVFTATNNVINGGFGVNNGQIQQPPAVVPVGDGNNTVEITFTELTSEAASMTFYVPLPVGTYGEYKVEIKGTNVDLSDESTNVSNTIARRTLLLMPTFTVENGQLTKGNAIAGVIDLDEGNQEADITDDAEVVVTPGTDADATATLNYTPADDGTSVLSISDGSGATESGESEGKVVVATSGNATIASCDINTPNLTVELSAADGTEVTYEEVTALTAQQTLIIGKGVTITKLTGNGGNVLINGGKVQEWSKGKDEQITITYVAKSAEDFESIPTFAEVVKLGGAITATETIEINSDVTINGENNTITSNASRVIELKASNINVTMKDLKIESTAVRSSGDIRGINIVPDMQNVSLTLENCSVDFSDESAQSGSYAVNQTDEDKNSNTITITGGSYNGANVINVWGDGHTVTIDGATLTSLYKPHDTYHGNGVRLEGKEVKLTVKNTTFEGVNAKAISQKHEGKNTIIEENNTNNAKNHVAKAGSTYYYSLKEAIEGAGNDEVKLLCDITLSESLEINSNVTIDGGNNTITSNASRVIELKESSINVTMKDLKIVSTAVRTSGDIRGINIVPDMQNVSLTLENCSVDFSDESAQSGSYAVNQTDEDKNSNTITITDGSYNGANVINVWGNGHTVTINGATLTSLYKPHDTYHGNGVRLEGKEVKLTVKNTTFEGVNAKAISQKHEGENTIDFDNNGNVNNTQTSEPQE